MTWNNRIVGDAVVEVSDLIANEANWRTHPQRQEMALRGVLDQVGWVQRVMVNKRTNKIVDGHLRVALAEESGDNKVPVTYVDLSEDEEALILATFDPISGMAGSDKALLADLVSGLESEHVGVREMLDLMALDSESGLELDDYSDAPSLDDGGETADVRDNDGLVNFECLMTSEGRALLYAAINKSKNDHELNTAGEALAKIAEEYGQ